MVNENELLKRKKILFNRRWYNGIQRLKLLGIELPDSITKEELWIKFRDTTFCEYCGCELEYWITSDDSLDKRILVPSIDHVLPLSRGGDNLIDNLAIVCAGCNYIKGTMSIELYGKLCDVILQHGELGLLHKWKVQAYKSALANKLDRVARENAEVGIN